MYPTGPKNTAVRFSPHGKFLLSDLIQRAENTELERPTVAL